jgi:uncharacterized membrane protein
MAEVAKQSLRSRSAEGGKQQRWLYLLTGFSLAILIWQSRPTGSTTDFFAWDILLISGFLTFVAGLMIAQGSRERLERMLDRLANRGSLTGETLTNIEVGLEARTRGWIRAGGLVVAASILIAFTVVIWLNRGTPRATSLMFLGLFEAGWGYIAGRYLGRMASYGCLGWFLNTMHARITVKPGYIDGAAGLKPIGDFYFRQAIVAAVPAGFLAIWWLIIPAWPDPSLRARYLQWMHPYLGLLTVAMVVEALAFVAPMRWFHSEMKRQKEQLLSEADELSEGIARIRIQLAESLAKPDRDNLNEQLSLKTKQYWDIEGMPTWPVDRSVARRFTLQNLGLLLPVVGEMTGLHEVWVKFLQGVLASKG